MGCLFKILRWVVGLFLGSTILVVVLYKFMPVVFTPLMFIRGVENITDGKSPFWHHTWVSLDKMSRYMPVAVIASEDQRFMSHHGFDFKAIEEAAQYNKKHQLADGSHTKVRGASTITQQTAKNVFLWPGSSVASRWVRKGFESYFTVLIELIWGKERIMEVYLNSIEMGDGIYGVQAVAEQNFDCDASDLTRSQCALVAATLPNPRVYSSKSPSNYMYRRQRAIQMQMKYIPLFEP
ncbi:MAG: monofunctional biosynthetic peptidoglycan transglycosylase [Prevotella sp.]|nr:monofunctional biosynthetic peptidoglycan transglycosylase [Candidatus Equicola stercoris]